MRVYKTGHVEIIDVPTHICTVPQDIQFVTVRNLGEEPVYFGGPQVNSGSDDGLDTGFPLFPGDVHDIPAYDSDATELWAVTASDVVATVAFMVSSGADYSIGGFPPL